MLIAATMPVSGLASVAWLSASAGDEGVGRVGVNGRLVDDELFGGHGGPATA